MSNDNVFGLCVLVFIVTFAVAFSIGLACASADEYDKVMEDAVKHGAAVKTEDPNGNTVYQWKEQKEF